METLDKHFRNLTRDAFARFGFSYAEVIARWPEIAGATLAAHCRPMRIRWPRGSGETDQARGGTLVIAAAPGRALDLQYEVPRIMERVNAFYGFGAIAAVKIVAQPKAFGEPPPRRPVAQKPFADPALDTIADDDLKAALQRLGAGVSARSAGSPQGK
ncbi:MAG: DciA family protein [Hyphomicrobiales bacterium]